MKRAVLGNALVLGRGLATFVAGDVSSSCTGDPKITFDSRIQGKSFPGQDSMEMRRCVKGKKFRRASRSLDVGNVPPVELDPKPVFGVVLPPKPPALLPNAGAAGAVEEPKPR